MTSHRCQYDVSFTPYARWGKFLLLKVVSRHNQIPYPTHYIKRETVPLGNSTSSKTMRAERGIRDHKYTVSKTKAPSSNDEFSSRDISDVNVNSVCFVCTFLK